MGSGGGAEAEMDGTYGKNGGIKNAKNNNGKHIWGKKEKKTAKGKVKDGSGKT